MKVSKNIAIIGCLLLTAFWHGVGTIPVTNSFSPMPLWGGGFVVGQNLSPTTGVRFLRTDSFGGYLWGTNDNSWHQVITASSFATAVCNGGIAGSCFGFYPTTGTSQSFQGAGGIIDIASAPSDATVAYMFYGGRVFKSTNVDPTHPDSIVWANTAFTKTADGSNTANRMNGHFMAIDPATSAHVFVGTQASGLWETKDGGTTWNQISSSDIPTATGITNYIITFDPASGVNGSGLTNTVYVFTSGATAGMYVSITGGGAGTWSLTSSGPSTLQHAAIGQTGSVLWAVDGGPNGNGSLWKYVCGADCASGTWTEVINAGNLHSVCINPNNANQIAALGNGGTLTVSTNGSTFGTALSFSLAAGDAPWQAVQATNVFGPTAGDCAFDPLNNGTIIFDGGQGVWTTTFPSSTFAWTAMVKGVMQPIGAQVIIPTSNNPVAGYQDLGSCTYNALSNTVTSCSPITKSKSLEYAAGLAVSVTDHNFMVAKISSDFNGQSDFSGYSTDGFAKNYLPFNSWNATVAAANAITNNGSGLIRATVPSTAGLSTWAAGSGSIICSYSTVPAAGNALASGGSSCFAATVVDSSHVDLQGSTFATSLTTTGGNYVFYQMTTPLSSWGGSGNVTGATSDGGLIQLSFMYNAGTLTNGIPVCVSGVLGTTEANGCWIAKNVNGSSRTLDLGPTSSFTNAYTGGGVVKTLQEPGGYIAAASDLNFALVGENDAIAPQCTTDGGKTWSDVTNAAVPAVFTTVTGGPYTAGVTSVTMVKTSALGSPIKIMMDDGRLFYTNVVSVVGTTVNFGTAIPAGRTISSGANVYTDSGWGHAAFLNQHNMVADTVQPNTFFIANYEVGLLKWTNCGATTVVNTGNINTGSGWQVAGNFNSTLKAVPGESGHLFYTAGPQGAPNGISPQGLWRTCNGDNNSSVDMTFRVTGFFAPNAIGFGAHAPGHSYPAIYVVGWYDPGGVEANAVWGVWRSIDDPNHGNSGASTSCLTGGTWTKIADWPFGWMNPPRDINGDPLIFGPVYMNTVAGLFYGSFNYLLNRDLHHDNDNSPAFLSHVA